MIALDLLRAGAVTVVAAPALLLLRRVPGRVRHAAFAAVLAASAVAPFAAGLVPAPVVKATAAMPLLGRAPEAAALANQGETFSPPAPAALVPVSLPEWLVLIPALAPLGRFVIGWGTARRWVRRATPDADGILISPDAPVPMTFFDGFAHRIMLPAESVGWSPERRRMVLLHERAHIARRDWWTQTAARVVVAFQWMNPFAWWMLRSMIDAAEEAADEVALGDGVPPPDYARELLALALPGPRPTGSLPMTPQTDLARRVVAVLQGPRPVARWTVALAALVPLALIVPAAALGGRAVQARSESSPMRVEATSAQFGNAENGWNAELPGVGAAKLEYVVGWFKGTPLAWRPDGTRVPLAGLPIAPVPPAPEYAINPKTKKPVKTGRGVANERMFVMSFQDPTGVMEAGVESASFHQGPARSLFGRGSWTTKPGRPGRRYTAGFIAYYQGFKGTDGKDHLKSAVGFAAGPVEARPILTYSEAKGLSVVTNPSFVPDFRVDGVHFEESPGVKGLGLVMTMKSVPSDWSRCPWLVAVATRKDGRVDTESPMLLYEGPKKFARPFYRFRLPQPRSAYHSIEILAGGTATTEFRDVALMPNGALQSAAP